MPLAVNRQKSAAELKAEELRAKMVQTVVARGAVGGAGDKLLASKMKREPAPPTRDRVSAAIALVRARQDARNRQKGPGLSLPTSPRSNSRPTSPKSPVQSPTNYDDSITASQSLRSPLSPKSPDSKVSDCSRNVQRFFPHIQNTDGSLSPKSQAGSFTTGSHSLRSPLAPKSPESNASSAGGEVVRLFPQIPNSAGALSPRSSSTAGTFLANVFASRADGGLSTTSIPTSITSAIERADQENSLEDAHGQEMPIEKTIITTKSNRDPPPSVSFDGPLVSTKATSTDSDECSVDPDTLTEVGRFIDALHNKSKHDKVETSTYAIKGQELLPSISSESTDGSLPVSAETLEGIGHFIDAIAKPNKQRRTFRASPSSSSDGDLPMATKASIEAFIDSLHEKSQNQENAKETMYVSSSEDDSFDHPGVSTPPAFSTAYSATKGATSENLSCDIDAFYNLESFNGSDDTPDTDQRLLDDALASEEIEVDEGQSVERELDDEVSIRVATNHEEMVYDKRCIGAVSLSCVLAGEDIFKREPTDTRRNDPQPFSSEDSSVSSDRVVQTHIVDSAASVPDIGTVSTGKGESIEIEDSMHEEHPIELFSAEEVSENTLRVGDQVEKPFSEGGQIEKPFSEGDQYDGTQSIGGQVEQSWSEGRLSEHQLASGENESTDDNTTVNTTVSHASDDVLDEALMAALESEIAAGMADDEEQQVGSESKNQNHQKIDILFSQGIESADSSREPLSPTSVGSEGLVLKVFSEMESIDEEDNINDFFSRMGTTRDERFYSKLTPPEGATRHEIERLNELVKENQVQALESERSIMFVAASEQQRSHRKEIITHNAEQILTTEVLDGVGDNGALRTTECADGTCSQHLITNSNRETVRMPKAGEPEPSSVVKPNPELVGLDSISRGSNDESMDLRRFGSDSHEHLPSVSDGLQTVDDTGVLEQSKSEEPKTAVRSKFPPSQGDSESNLGGVDAEAGELLNLFLRGSEDLMASRNGSAVKSSESEEDMDDIENLIEKAGLSNIGFFTKFFWGATEDEIIQRKTFLKLAIPFLQDETLAPLVAEAQIRSSASRGGIPQDDIESMLDQIPWFREDIGLIGDARSMDTVEMSRKLEFTEHQKIEDLDLSENISAFLNRMEALEKGGHFGQSEKADQMDEEGVEIDVDHGFINRQLESVLSDEAAWWQHDAENSERNKWSRNKESVQTSFSEDELELDTILQNTLYKERDTASRRSRKSCSPSPRKARIPRSNSNSERPHTPSKWSTPPPIGSARSFVLPYEDEKTDLVHSLSLTRVPSMLSDLETMFEDRDRWVRHRPTKLMTWQSPWEKRWRNGEKKQSISLTDTSKAERLSGVAAARKLSTWTSRRKQCLRMPVKQHWRLAYRERTKLHRGYFEVDVYSIYEATDAFSVPHPYDDDPWESRGVKQRFLHEQSISMSRNWFGDLQRKRGNDRYREPVAHPKSMEMPMENLPGEGEWIEEWYTTWQQRQNNTRKRHLLGESDSDSESDGSETYTEGDGTTYRDDETGTIGDSIYSESVYTSRRSEYSNRRNRTMEDDDSWEDPPECGVFQNAKQRIGERLSLVHPDHLSSLRQSRWRRKHFPRGTFPYK